MRTYDVERPLGTTEFAERIGVSYWTVRRWIKNGTIEAYRAGPKLLRIPRSELDRMNQKIEAQG